jgi:hypothetical protein
MVTGRYTCVSGSDFGLMMNRVTPDKQLIAKATAKPVVFSLYEEHSVRH